eukprot:1147675-Pelagomonas_calceolata.AAC.8
MSRKDRNAATPQSLRKAAKAANLPQVKGGRLFHTPLLLYQSCASYLHLLQQHHQAARSTSEQGGVIIRKLLEQRLTAAAPTACTWV